MEKKEIEILEIKGLDMLPQIAGQLARFDPNAEGIREDSELVELCKKSRKYISLLLDKAIEAMAA